VASEARELQRRRAGLVSRFVADAIDLVVVLLAVVLVYFGWAAARFLVAPRRFTWPDPGAIAHASIGWLLLVLYLTFAWSATGRSIGKQLMGLRVERRDGSPLGLGLAFVRALLCAAVPIGLFWSAFSRESASVQDLIVRTKVVYDWRPRVPARAADG